MKLSMLILARCHGVGMLVLGLLCLGQTGCFQVSQETDLLRGRILKAAGAVSERRFEAGVGWATLGLIRAGVSLANIDPKASQVLDALRGGDISICQLAPREAKAPYGSVLAEADQAMKGQNWERLVTVMDGGQLVMIYVPDHPTPSREIKVCVVVLNPGQLIIASARSEVEPLLKLYSSVSSLP